MEPVASRSSRFCLIANRQVIHEVNRHVNREGSAI